MTDEMISVIIEDDGYCLFCGKKLPESRSVGCNTSHTRKAHYISFNARKIRNKKKRKRRQGSSYRRAA